MFRTYSYKNEGSRPWQLRGLHELRRLQPGESPGDDERSSRGDVEAGSSAAGVGCTGKRRPFVGPSCR